MRLTLRWIAHARRCLSRRCSSTVSPALLARAEALHEEKLRLETQLLSGYDEKTATRLAALKGISSAFKEYTSAEETREELENLIKQTPDEEMVSLAKEDLESTRFSLANLGADIASALIPDDPLEDCPCIFEIRPGVGGDEAAIFANDIYNMYIAYCALQKWPTRTILLSKTTSGISEAIFSVDGKGAFGKLNGEAGVHRVQRIPATEAKGRVHTSTASVHVLPSVTESKESVLRAEDVKVEVMRSRGAGGQHVNTTDSAVRLTHHPTGITVSMQDSRSQHQNRAKAWLVLEARVAEKQREEAEAADILARRAQNRVTDHRCGYNLYNLEQCMNGTALGEIVEAVRAWKRDEAIRGLGSSI